MRYYPSQVRQCPPVAPEVHIPFLGGTVDGGRSSLFFDSRSPPSVSVSVSLALSLSLFLIVYVCLIPVTPAPISNPEGG
jgi:hypothetical protein